MDKEVVRYGIHTVTFWIGGIFSALFALVFFLLVLFLMYWGLLFEGGFHTADGLILAGLFMWAALAVWCIGMVVRKPTGLRLDVHGISGYFAPTVEWSEIKTVPKKVGSGGKTIWLDLHNSRTFWARQKAWARIASALHLQAGMVGIQVNLIRARPEDILEMLRRMHARYG